MIDKQGRIFMGCCMLILAVSIVYATIRPVSAQTARTATCLKSMSAVGVTTGALEKDLNALLSSGKTEIVPFSAFVCGW